jgi:hypothetical protein
MTISCLKRSDLVILNARLNDDVGQEVKDLYSAAH